MTTDFLEYEGSEDEWSQLLKQNERISSMMDYLIPTLDYMLDNFDARSA